MDFQAAMRTFSTLLSSSPLPLTVMLPNMGLGVDGVFWAEPISNVLGGLACFITMWLTVYRKLGDKQTETLKIKV